MTDAQTIQAAIAVVKETLDGANLDYREWCDITEQLGQLWAEARHKRKAKAPASDAVHEMFPLTEPPSTG